MSGLESWSTIRRQGGGVRARELVYNKEAGR